jgi:WD40 repeat protein
MSEVNNPIESTFKPHNGGSITKIEISPNSEYLVTYSKKDLSIVGWDVNNIDEGRLEPDITVKIEGRKLINQICVSDDKKLVYIYTYDDIAIKFYLGK